MFTPATCILIGINIVLFIAESACGGSESNEVALRFGAQYTPYIRQGQWYRLFTSMFLHAGFIHLICNMYSLYNLGPALEVFFGIPIFTALYLASGLSGNLVTYFSEKRSGHYTLSLGASGAVFGLLGSYLVLALWPDIGGVSLYGILHVLVINALYTFSNRKINARAHIGGLAAGVIITAAMLFFLT